MNVELRSVKRVAILRALQLGDLLCAIPALRALRNGLPSARMTLIGLPWASELVERYPRYIDEFLELPGWPGLPEQECRTSDLPAFLLAAHEKQFDLAIQLHGNGSVTNGLIASLGAAHTAGFTTPGGFTPEPALFVDYPDTGPEVCRLLSLVEHLGFPPCGSILEFPIFDLDRLGCAALEIPFREYVCLHVGARDTARRWSTHAFAAVADQLAERGLGVVLTGTTADVETVASVQNEMRHACVNLCGRTNLGTLAALLHSARLVVCNDTGVSHLADATKTPSVVIFTTSDPHRWAPLDDRRHRVLQTPASAEDVLLEAGRLLALES